MGSMASGRGGTSPEKVAMIERLLGEGLSDREIARRVRVRRELVAKVQRVQPAGENDESPVYERCGGCGVRVVMPCRACAVRELTNDAKAMPPTMHTVLAMRRQQAAPADRSTVCGECNKRTTDLYFVHPATNRLTADGRCPDCQERAVARALRPALPPARDERPVATADFCIPQHMRRTS